MPSWQTLGSSLQNKEVKHWNYQKMSTVKVLVQYSYNKLFSRKIKSIFDTVKWSGKSEFRYFCHLRNTPCQKIWKKSFKSGHHPIFCITREQSKPLFWFRSNTETETLIGWYRNRYRNRYRNHPISDVVIYLHRKCGVFFPSNKVPEFKFQVK